MIETLYIITFMIIIIIGIIKIANDTIKPVNKSQETKYIDYAKFYGAETLKDQDFIKKMKIIYSQIIKSKEEDIKQIAELAGCTYAECILKIRYLKQIKKIPENYFVDEANGLVNRCSKEEQELLKKYRPYIYRSKLQIPEIAARIPHIPGKTFQEIQKQVLEDLAYLDEKDLIDGILLNKVDGTITYYNTKGKNKNSDKITVNCQNCGAPNHLNRGGKTWCSYCGSIVEDTSLEEKGD